MERSLIINKWRPLDACVITSRDKLDTRAHKCIFIGYIVGQKANKVYDLNTHSIRYSKEVLFCEHKFPYQHNDEALFEPCLPMNFDEPIMIKQGQDTKATGSNERTTLSTTMDI